MWSCCLTLTLSFPRSCSEIHEHAKREKVLVSAFFYNYSLIENVRKLARQSTMKLPRQMI